MNLEPVHKRLLVVLIALPLLYFWTVGIYHQIDKVKWEHARSKAVDRFALDSARCSSGIKTYCGRDLQNSLDSSEAEFRASEARKQAEEHFKNGLIAATGAGLIGLLAFPVARWVMTGKGTSENSDP